MNNGENNCFENVTPQLWNKTSVYLFLTDWNKLILSIAWNWGCTALTDLLIYTSCLYPRIQVEYNISFNFFYLRIRESGDMAQFNGRMDTYRGKRSQARNPRKLGRQAGEAFPGWGGSCWHFKIIVLSNVTCCFCIGVAYWCTGFIFWSSKVKILP